MIFYNEILARKSKYVKILDEIMNHDNIIKDKNVAERITISSSQSERTKLRKSLFNKMKVQVVPQ